MRTLVRWNPAREFNAMNHVMNRLVDEFSGGSLPPMTNDWKMPLDVMETEDGFEVVASLPGVNPDDINVTLENKVLTIQAEITEDEVQEEERYHIRERRVGSFERSLRLPATIATDDIVANYEHGILTLTLPKAEEIKPKRIGITVNGTE